MNLEVFKVFAESNIWSALWVEIALVLLALGLLVLELVLPANAKRTIPSVAIAGQIILLVLASIQLIQMPDDCSGMYFSQMILQTPQSAIMRIFFLLGGIFVSYLGTVYLARRELPKMEFFHIVLVVTAAFMILVQSHHFVVFFVALETLTIGFYVLVAYCRTSSASLEAGLKFLILGGFSSAMLLFGIVLLYGVAGNPLLPGYSTDSMNFSNLATFITQNPTNPLVLGGAVLVLVGMAFKIGVVPFQIWVPDVYQGAPTPVTAFLAVCSKAAGFIVIINLLNGPFLGLSDVFIPLLAVVAGLTILFGNIAPLSQRNVKRVMGLSGVAHAGYLLAGVVAILCGSAIAHGAIIFYLFTYLLGSFAVFAVMAHVSQKEDEIQEIDHYENFAKHNPFLALALVCGLGSLAGIPPLAGFIGKLILFIAIFKAGLYTLLGIAILGVVISIYYYFGWIREAFFHIYAIGERGTTDDREQLVDVLKPTPMHALAIGVLVTGILVLGFYQGGLIDRLFYML